MTPKTTEMTAEIDRLKGELRAARQENERLRTRDEWVTAALKVGQVGVFDYDPRTGAVSWDKSVHQFWGVPCEETPTCDTFIRELHPDDRPVIEQAVQEALDPAIRRPYRTEYRVINRQTGTVRWLRAKGNATFQEGVAVRLVGTVYDITQHKQVEEALRESEARFRHMADHAPVIVWVSEPDGTCTYLSKTWLDLTGQTPEAGLGRGWLDVVHPDDQKRTLDIYLNANAEQKPLRLEYRLRGRNGGWLWCIAVAQPRFGLEGRFLGLVGSTLDITERKEIELALRQREERLAAVLRATDLGSWHWNLQTNEGEINQRYAEMLGYDASETKLTFDDFSRLVHPEDLEPVKKALEEHFEGKTDLYSVEIRLRHSEGHWVWVLTSGRVVERDRAGKPLVMTGVHQDISARVAAVRALRRSEEQFRLLADNIHQFAWMADATGWIYWYNKRWLDYTGTSLEEMQGWGWRKVHHPEHVDRVVKKISESFATGEPWEDTFPLRSKDGEYRWFLSRALPARDKYGRVVRWFGTNTDITERLRAEQNRELLVNELNHRVKNTLAIVQGIAQQTFRMNAGTGRELTKTFQNRLGALATAHNLLTCSNWEFTSLRELAIQSINSGCAPTAPVHIDGPQVVLTPKQAITFAMAFHELCTNATKYGALSKGCGRIEIAWRVSGASDGQKLALVWRESGGPVVKPPHRRGFGLRMIEEALARELDGEVTLNFRPEGFVCEINGTLERNGSGSEWIR